MGTSTGVSLYAYQEPRVEWDVTGNVSEGTIWVTAKFDDFSLTVYDNPERLAKLAEGLTAAADHVRRLHAAGTMRKALEANGLHVILAGRPMYHAERGIDLYMRGGLCGSFEAQTLEAAGAILKGHLVETYGDSASGPMRAVAVDGVLAWADDALLDAMTAPQGSARTVELFGGGFAECDGPVLLLEGDEGEPPQTAEAPPEPPEGYEDGGELEQCERCGKKVPGSLLTRFGKDDNEVDLCPKCAEQREAGKAFTDSMQHSHLGILRP